MKGTRKRHELTVALAFLAPNLIGFGVFTCFPVLYSFFASLSNWNLQNPNQTSFVGFRNYAVLLQDPQFWTYLINTGYFFLGLPFAIMGSLWLAILLNRKLSLGTAYRTLLYIPSFTSGVAIMILWKSLYNPDYGPINETLRHFIDFIGLNGQITPPQWLSSTKNVFGLEIDKPGINPTQFGIGARDALIYMGIWTAIGGNNMLLYLAALTNVPEELVEATQIDGASRWQSFLHVIWPTLAPTTFFIVIMSIIGGMQGGFEQAKVMTNGGPAGTTTTVAYHIYTKAFEEFQVGYASAIAWVLFAIVFGLSLFTWKFGNRAGENG